MRYLYIYRWHSVNLIPSLSVCSTCNDDPPDYSALGRLYQFVWLGLVLNISRPSKKTFRGWCIRQIGPCYSLRRKCWYLYPPIAWKTLDTRA